MLERLLITARVMGLEANEAKTKHMSWCDEHQMGRKLTIKLNSGFKMSVNQTVVRPIVTDGYAVWIQKMRTDNARKLLRKHIQKKNCKRNLLTNNEPSIEGIVTGQRLRWMDDDFQKQIWRKATQRNF